MIDFETIREAGRSKASGKQQDMTTIKQRCLRARLLPQRLMLPYLHDGSHKCLEVRYTTEQSSTKVLEIGLGGLKPTAENMSTLKVLE